MIFLFIIFICFIIGVIKKKIRKNELIFLLLYLKKKRNYYAFECFLNILKIIAIFNE